jgi:PKD repeat protein
VTISNVYCQGDHFAIAVVSSSNIFVGNNYCFEDQIAIEIAGSSNTLVENNSVTANSIGGIIFYTCSISRACDNNFTNNVNGLLLFGGSNTINVSTNRFYDNNESSIESIDAFGANYNNTIERNTIQGSNASTGIVLQSENNTMLISNDITNASVGIFLYQGVNDSISSMSIENCSLYAIEMKNVSRDMLRDDIVGNSSMGLYLFENSTLNSVVNNTIENNTRYGINIEAGSQNNLIYLNEFVNNTVNAHDNASNAWDNGTYGNYWSDYISKYPSAVSYNGIWKTAYTINATTNSVDHYPLVHPSSYLVPVAIFAANATNVRTGQPIKFTFTGSLGNTPTSFNWSFGDASNSTDQDPVHSYALPGLYTVSLTIIDTDNETSLSTLVKYINVTLALNPRATFSVNATSIIAGQSIAFTFDGFVGNPPSTFSWHFGDGSTSNSTNPVHKYLTLGTFNASLTVTDLFGAKNTTSILITIRALALPGPFTLSTNATNPDTSGFFVISWTPSPNARNYTLYLFSKPITTINGSLTMISNGLTNASYFVSMLVNGTYYYAMVAYSEDGNTTSNCVSVVVQISTGTQAPSPLLIFLSEYGLYLVIVSVGVVLLVIALSLHSRRAKKRGSMKTSGEASAVKPIATASLKKKVSSNIEQLGTPAQQSDAAQRFQDVFFGAKAAWKPFELASALGLADYPERLYAFINTLNGESMQFFEGKIWVDINADPSKKEEILQRFRLFISKA